MSDGILFITLVAVLGGLGTWLLLPLKHGSWSRRWGATTSRMYSQVACAAAGAAVAAPLITAIGRSMSPFARAGLALGLGVTFAVVGFVLGSLRSVRDTPYGIILGVLLSALALAFFASTWTPPGGPVQAVFFDAFAVVAMVGGVLTITSRDPVHSALWFASVVLSTSGLFLLAGAQFLAAGTIIVYAGAIIVTFLFVIMLAQSEGQALYDRQARAPGVAAISGFGIAWATFYAILAVGAVEGQSKFDPAVATLVPAAHLVGRDTSNGQAAQGLVRPGDGPAIVQRRAISQTARIASGPASAHHVAGIGATLFTDHLLAVEIGGALLFIALVGAISMATPRPPIRPADRSGIAAGDIAQARNLAKSSV